MLKPKAIVCDIDNCLVDISKIESEIEDTQELCSEKAFKFFEERANDMSWVIKSAPLFFLLKYYYDSNYEIIILTARSKVIATETYKFLTSGIPKLPKDITLISRELDEEGIPDDVLKESKLEKLLEDYDIEISIDDKAKNCEMFKRHNIFTLQVVL